MTSKSASAGEIRHPLTTPVSSLFHGIIPGETTVVWIMFAKVSFAEKAFVFGVRMYIKPRTPSQESSVRLCGLYEVVKMCSANANDCFNGFVSGSSIDDLTWSTIALSDSKSTSFRGMMTFRETDESGGLVISTVNLSFVEWRRDVR